MAEACGTPASEQPAATVGALLKALERRYGAPFREQQRTCKVIVNGRNVATLQRGRTPLGDDDEVWFLPPAGGG